MKRLFLILLAVMMMAAAPSRDNSYTSGTTISSSDVAANEDAIFTYLQNGIDVIADNSIVAADIQSGAVTTSKILDGTVANADLAGSIADSKLSTITTAAKVNTSALTTTTGVVGQLLVNDGDTWEAIANGDTNEVLTSTPGNMPTWAAVSTFTDRGDAAADDKAVGDFTTDGTWNDLDLSSIVTDTDAKAILFKISIQDGATGSSMKFRKNGNSQAYNTNEIETQVAAITQTITMVVPCDTSQVIEYNGSNVTFEVIAFMVLGWWN